MVAVSKNTVKNDALDILNNINFDDIPKNIKKSVKTSKKQIAKTKLISKKSKNNVIKGKKLPKKSKKVSKLNKK